MRLADSFESYYPMGRRIGAEDPTKLVDRFRGFYYQMGQRIDAVIQLPYGRIGAVDPTTHWAS